MADASLKPDATAIAAALKTHSPSLTEIRLLNCGRRKMTISGYFDAQHYEQAAAELVRLDDELRPEGSYFTFNEIDPAALAFAANHFVEQPKRTTSDKNIVRRKWLLVDCDPRRISGVSATDAEKQRAKECAQRVRKALTERGWPAPGVGDSGNGYHLLYRIDLPNDDASSQLVKRVLTALDLLFSDTSVSIDTSVFNAARIAKLFGTVARKGDSTPDRPHRLAQSLVTPENQGVVSAEQLAELAKVLPENPGVYRNGNHNGATFNLEHWLAERGLPMGESVSYEGGRKWLVNRGENCLFGGAHDAGGCFIIEWPGGAIAAGCRHESCAGQRWQDLRKKHEPEYDPDRKRESGSDSAASKDENQNAPAESDEWPDPEEVGVEPLPVPKCDPVMLPESVRPFLTDIAERQQSPLEFSTVALIVAASAVIGRKLGIRPKREDDWQVVPNLWGALIGPPGVLMKTPTLNDALRPLDALVAKAAADHQEALVGFELDAVWSDGQKKKIANSVAKDVKAGADRDDIRARYADEYAEALVEKPTERRYMTSDSTVEKLGELLNENPNGVLLKRDELPGWLRSLERQGREGERAFFLEAWNGSGKFDYDRIGRGTLHIEATCVSVLGGIQPGPLSAYLQEAFARGGDDGLIQRFQLAVYPDLTPDWRNVDREPDAQAQQRVAEIFVELDRLEPAGFGAIIDNGNPPFVRFTDEAQELFNTWRGELELRLRSGEEHQVVIGHLAKFRSLMPSLALIFELMDFVSRPQPPPAAATAKVVTLRSAQLAAGWCDFLEAHARRIYQGITAQVLVAAASLADKIRRRKLPNPFKPHAIYHAGWNGLSSPSETYSALEILEEAGWVRRREMPTTTSGGRPTILFDINPKVLPQEQG